MTKKLIKKIIRTMKKAKRKNGPKVVFKRLEDGTFFRIVSYSDEKGKVYRTEVEHWE